MNKEVRLQKFLSECGVASRRKSEELIIKGLVKVNGKEVPIGFKIIPGKDKVTVNGKDVKLNRFKKYYIMLYKPRGYVTTMHDELGRKCVADLVKDIPARVYPVGRLDRDSEGLLLMTNDGDFSNNIIHPSKHIDKTYRVTVRSSVTDEQLTQLCTGIEIDGYETAPAKVRIVKEELSRTVLEISIQEGRNRQIRKMCEQANLEVARLKRVSIGFLKLGMLKSGRWRDLTQDEINTFI